MTNEALEALIAQDQAGITQIAGDLDTILAFVTTAIANKDTVDGNIELAANNLSTFLASIKQKADSVAQQTAPTS